MTDLTQITVYAQRTKRSSNHGRTFEHTQEDDNVKVPRVFRERLVDLLHVGRRCAAAELLLQCIDLLGQQALLRL